MRLATGYSLQTAQQRFYNCQVSGAVVFGEYRVASIHDGMLFIAAGPNEDTYMFQLADSQAGDAVEIYGDSEELEQRLVNFLASEAGDLAGLIEHYYDLSQDRDDDDLKERRFKILKYSNQAMAPRDIAKRVLWSESTVKKHLMLMKAIQNIARKKGT